jgi:hypothetical protein
MGAGASTQNGAGGGAGADLDHYQSKSLARPPLQNPKRQELTMDLQSSRSRSPPRKTKSKRRESQPRESTLSFASDSLSLRTCGRGR